MPKLPVVVVAALAAGCSSDPPTHAEQMIGAQGGTLELGDVAVEIPAGALASGVMITLDVSDEMPTHGEPSISPLYEIGPSGLTFAMPVIVSLPYSGSDESGIYQPTLTTLEPGAAYADLEHLPVSPLQGPPPLSASWSARFQLVKNWATTAYDFANKLCESRCSVKDTTFCRFFDQRTKRTCDPIESPFMCAASVMRSSGCTSYFTCNQATSVKSCGLCDVGKPCCEDGRCTDGTVIIDPDPM